MASLGCFVGGLANSGEEDLDGKGDVNLGKRDGDCEEDLDWGEGDLDINGGERQRELDGSRVDPVGLGASLVL